MKTNEKDKKEKKSYWPVAFRWKVIQLIDAGLLDDRHACEKYEITAILIRKWRKQYHERKIQPLLTTQPMKRNQNQTEKIKALEKQLKQTQKALQDEKVKSRAYEIMIDIAEQELNIPVRGTPCEKSMGPDSKPTPQRVSIRQCGKALSTVWPKPHCFLQSRKASQRAILTRGSGIRGSTQD